MRGTLYLVSGHKRNTLDSDDLGWRPYNTSTQVTLSPYSPHKQVGRGAQERELRILPQISIRVPTDGLYGRHQVLTTAYTNAGYHPGVRAFLLLRLMR